MFSQSFHLVDLQITLKFLMVLFLGKLFMFMKRILNYKRLTYGAIHPGNNKQSMPLALAIFDESTTGAIKCYFPLAIKCHFFFCSVSKTLCYMQLQNTTIFPIYLKMQLFVMISSQNFYYLLSATWIEQWSTYQNFSLAKQASQAAITTLKATSCLLPELLNEGYKYVLTRFQSDPLE